ncbi:hypothetical protein Goari_011847 [Gossypium aridum]|uniref:Uncharacterized protein n=1 Tax=Gossypium aridum TaxID=34290 RepID=A0A7J8WYN6_GOSAI|nr:hypothetical protein [Gossypium aridum]
MVGCTLWVLWIERNKFMHDEIKNQPQAILERIQAQLEELYALNEMLLVIRVEIVIWKPSKNAFIKINFDGGFSSPFLEIMFEDCYQKSKGSYSGIDGERLGGVPLDCEMKIGFKVLLGYSLWKTVVKGSKSQEEKIGSGDIQATIECFRF